MASTYFGVREYVNIMLLLLSFYGRHKNNIDDALGTELAEAMSLLLDATEIIQALNPPGPA
jgi:hypothetical protein